MKNRITSLLLILTLIVGLLPIGILSASAVTASGTCGENAFWELTDDGTLVISGIGAMTDYESDWGARVQPWYNYGDLIKSIVVCEGITHIGDEAFGSFYGSGAKLRNLQSVSLPSSLKSIGIGAFYNTPLTTITLPQGLETIDYQAFAGSELTSVMIPKNVSTIRWSSFDCATLMEVIVDSENPYFTVKENVLYSKDMTQLIFYPYSNQKTCFEIPSTVVGEIDLYKFWGIEALESIIVPSGVTMVCSALPPDGCLDENLTEVFSLYFYGEIPDTSEFYFVKNAKCIPIKVYSCAGTSLSERASCNGGTDCYSTSYTDAPKVDNWAHAGIDYVLEKGLFNGMNDTTFSPNTETTRAMLVTVLWRYAGKPKEGTNCFTDVPDGKWYTEAVAWAAHNGIVNGIGNNKFNPDGTITREQMATIMYRYCELMGIDNTNTTRLNSFPDGGKVSGWAEDALSWAVAEGLINGTKNDNVVYLDPQGGATRAQVATILMRFIENVVE